MHRNCDEPQTLNQSDGKIYVDYIFGLKIHNYTYQKFKLIIKLSDNSTVIGFDSS